PADRLALDGELEPLEEEIRVLEGRLGEDDRELVAAHAAGDVGAANDEAQPLGDLGEHGVPSEVTDLLVDPLEVVEVEEQHGEATVVAVRPLDLVGQGLVEVAPVVKPGQWVTD